VLNAIVWGFVAASSLVIGGLIASWMTISQRTLGLILAFGAGVPETWISFVQTFAAGAILTMLANSMIPEAYQYGGKLAGLLLVLGFAVAVSVVALEHSSVV